MDIKQILLLGVISSLIAIVISRVFRHYENEILKEGKELLKEGKESLKDAFSKDSDIEIIDRIVPVIVLIGLILIIALVVYQLLKSAARQEAIEALRSSLEDAGG